MKSRDILEALNDTDEKLIADSAPKKKKSKKPLFIGGGITAAVCAGIAGVMFLNNVGQLAHNAGAIVKAVYPKTPQYNVNMFGEGETKEWRHYRREQRTNGLLYSDTLYDFTQNTAPLVLSDEENTVYSPINIYEAAAMLAEITDGDSRAQLLEMLSVDDIDTLRETANAIWTTNYFDDDTSSSILANSVWLSDSLEYSKAPLLRLAENYHASSFSGEMGSENYNKLLQNWLNENTKGMLKEQAGKIEMPEETLVALASTVYFKARWDNEFSDKNNTESVFHAPDGDVTAEFMNKKELTDHIAYGEKFTAFDYRFYEGGQMRFILPDEGVSIEELLNDKEIYDYLSASWDEWEKREFRRINFSVPKFDITNDTEISDMFKALGVTDVFDMDKADFSPLLGNLPSEISKVQHAARVTIDEEGCTAAAFTVMMDCGAALPPDEVIDFTLDRPFIFVIESDCGSPLFMGVISNPTEG